jgi:hypothetical protein
MKTIVKDIIVLSAQAVAYRLAPKAKAISAENEPRAQRIGF